MLEQKLFLSSVSPLLLLTEKGPETKRPSFPFVSVLVKVDLDVL